MSFRSTSCSKDTSTNLQRDSYECGYGGGRTDLPAVGYNPVHPSYPDTYANSVVYSQVPTASTSYSYQGTSNSYTYASPYGAEYNPTYPSYSHQYHQENPAPTSIVAVDKSRYSVKNTLYKNFAAPQALATIPRPRTFATTNGKKNTTVKIDPNIQTSEASTSSVPLDTTESTSEGVSSTQDKITAVETIANENNSKKKKNKRKKKDMRAPPPNVRARGGKVMKDYRENPYGVNPWATSSFGHAPWHSSPPQNVPPAIYGSGLVMPGLADYHFARAPNRYNRSQPQPYNNKDDIPFVPIPEGTETITLQIDPDNLECFSGPTSIFTMQHVAPVLIGDSIYESIDHYYQYRKLIDLCGNASEKITHPRIRKDEKNTFNEKRGLSFSQIAREQLKLNSVEKEIIEQWRCTKGLKAIQDGLEAKISQDPDLRLALSKTKNKILVHAYGGDTIYGTGSYSPQIKKWCANMKKSGNTHLIIPAFFPLTEDTIKHCPTFSHGRNVLGVILMQLREKLAHGSITTVNMKTLFDAIKEGRDPNVALIEDMNLSGEFSIGGGVIQASMEK